jgi:hypothetical protein
MQLAKTLGQRLVRLITSFDSRRAGNSKEPKSLFPEAIEFPLSSVLSR